MGLILGDESKGEAPVILTDILGSEDALGDMDFKVAGDGDGISAFQMDIKVEGITLPVLREALESARTGLVHILGEMDKADAQIALALAAADELLPLVTENPQLRTSGECFPFTTFRRLQSPPYHGNCSLIQITRD